MVTDLHSEESQYTYLLRPDAAFAESIEPGARATVSTEDSSGGQVTAGVSAADVDRSRFFPVTGPYEIEGVRAGDTVAIQIHGVQSLGTPHTWTRPGLGIREVTELTALDLDPARLSLLSHARPGVPIVQVEPNLHIGALGLLPSQETPPNTLGAHGGNLDFPQMSAGATLWLQAQVDGGGFFVGDLHAAMGEAEVCGTGAEVAGSVEVSFTKDTTWTPGLPTVRAPDGQVWIIGIGASFEEALREAVDYCVDRLAAVKDFPRDELYLATGMLLKVKICQVVNPRTSVAVSLGSGFDEYLQG